MKRAITVGCSVIALSAMVSTALAQARPDVLVKQRQAAMTLIGKYFGPLGLMAQDRVPFDTQVVERNAELLQALAQMPWDGFHESTKGEKSRSLPAVWTNREQYERAAERFQSEVRKLTLAAEGGDERAMRAQIGAISKTCSECHNSFRAKQ